MDIMYNADFNTVACKENMEADNEKISGYFANGNFYVFWNYALNIMLLIFTLSKSIIESMKVR